jgi:hypothetical protein
MARYLRNKVDGTIYHWGPILAKNPRCEEVTEEEAFPERFLPEKHKGRKARVDLATSDIPEEPEVTTSDAMAQKGLPK